MSTLREAAQQALEALDLCRDWPGAYDECGSAITALRAALAQQEQEPVEIKPPNPEGATQCIVRWLAETPAGWVGAWDREALERLERFTAHPPRREWRGLTEEEIWKDERIMAENARCGLMMSDLSALARAIEQACKEKNHG